MATEGPLLRDGAQMQANADLSAKQFFGVKVDTSADRKVILANTGGEGIYGILQNKPTSGQAADVALVGVSKAAINGTVTRGDLLMTDNTGQFVTATGGNHAVAQALESGAAGTLITVALMPGAGVGKVL